ncbi:uncharacterized protein LOC132545452 [Ylistrum balloti]|uniref:uncharacterized protein LOC132545452 n=1 Tax=Ylistrum balloti TaxID=509963 RepID=UPI0029058F51|nr:uncharacterized protein LOC132545452 [Ylistrum balloti]
MITIYNIQFVTWIISLIEIIQQVSADTQYCSDTGERCDYPKTCCPSGCCYGINNNHDHHAYSFRVSFYNLWYFWFIVLFVLMSCFGGCGYYKQRQRFARSRGVCAVTVTSQLGHNSRQTSTLRSGINVNPSHIPASHSNFGYTGSGDVRSGVTMQPPAYSEVMMQPELYPTHKSELVLPPYPGTQHIVSTNSSGGTDSTSSGLPQPPPYSLFQSSNQGSPNQEIHSPTANQNADYSTHQPQNLPVNQ